MLPFKVASCSSSISRGDAVMPPKMALKAYITSSVTML